MNRRSEPTTQGRPVHQGSEQVAPVPGLVFHHVGVACSDFAKEEGVFAVLGYRREGEDFKDPTQGIEGRFLVGAGPRLELLRNLEGRDTLTPWLRKGIRFYHVAYEVDDLSLAADRLAAAGAKVVVSPVPAVAFNGRKIAFFMLPNLSLIELISDR